MSKIYQFCLAVYQEQEYIAEALRRSDGLSDGGMYIREKNLGGAKHEFIREVAPGIELLKHWEIDDPERAVLDIKFVEHDDDFSIPELFSGVPGRVVSDQLKTAIQSVDDFPHQFLPIRMFDRDGKEMEAGQRWVFFVVGL